MKFVIPKVPLFFGVCVCVLALVWFLTEKVATPPNTELSDVGLVIAAVNSVAEQPVGHVLVYHSVRPIYEGITDEVGYYTVSPESFELHLQYLRDCGYDIVPLDDLAVAAEGGKSLPLHPVAITLDDGWKNQYLYAFPLLKKYNAPATFFIFTNAIGHPNYMSWNEIRELVAAGMAIGSHSKSHPYLDRITDLQELEKEIAGSKERIETETGREVSAFAYPFGVHSDLLESLVRETGYREARTFTSGTFRVGENPFLIKGIAVVDDMKQFKQLLTCELT